ncbi:MAG: hypothetical protein NXI13_03175 [Proteobacteria bacterium]|nr:hypothetical protein [Pseudomonadota bacterium]
MSYKKLLKEAKTRNTLVSVHMDTDDWDQFSVGYVDCLTDTHFRLSAISRYGAPFGFEVLQLSEIAKIEAAGKYERKIEFLAKSQGAFFKEIVPKSASSTNLILDTLTQSLEEAVVISIWGMDAEASLVGIVEKMDAETASIQIINQYGEDDGLSTIKITDIKCINLNTHFEQVRKFLYESDY